MNKLRLLSIIVLSALIPAVSLAQTTVELAMDETFEFTSLATSTSVFARVENNRSYCCQIIHFGDSSVVPSFTSLAPNLGMVLNLANRGKDAPWTGAGGNSVASRKCFRYEREDATANSFITLGIGASTPPIPDARLRCQDTTLYGGFNTVVTDFNFIEVTNTSIATDVSSVISVNVRATGTLAAAQVLNQTFTLAPGARKDVDVHSVAGSDFGPVTITHNGAPGSIRAVNVQYRIVTASPLDFEPVLGVQFREGLAAK